MIAWAAIRALAGGRELGGDGLHQRFDAEDVDHPLHVVGEHLQAHFRTDLFERPGQEKTTNWAQAARIASPLSRRKSAIVLKSGINRPVSHINSMLRWLSRSSLRLDWMRLR